MSRLLRRPGRLLVWFALTVMTVFAGFPIYWMLNTALSTSAELFGTGQGLIPQPGRAGSVIASLEAVNIYGLLRNSAAIAFGTTFLSLLIAIGAAYALSRYQFHGKGIAGFFLFATQMLPQALLIVPLFALFVSLGLINELYGLVLANTAFSMPVAVFILKTGIDKIPYEIEESARVDGCPKLGQLGLIVVPLILPSIAAAAVITFFDGWNEFLFANTFIQSSAKWPASVGLAQFMGQYSTPLETVMASALLFTLPAVVFFLIVQRRIISGLTAGAVKG
jgi:multiple sugar transport system permease protein